MCDKICGASLVPRSSHGPGLCVANTTYPSIFPVDSCQFPSSHPRYLVHDRQPLSGLLPLRCVKSTSFISSSVLPSLFICVTRSLFITLLYIPLGTLRSHSRFLALPFTTNTIINSLALHTKNESLVCIATRRVLSSSHRTPCVSSVSQEKTAVHSLTRTETNTTTILWNTSSTCTTITPRPILQYNDNCTSNSKNTTHTNTRVSLPSQTRGQVFPLQEHRV
jgi:hypothetical protein